MRREKRIFTVLSGQFREDKIIPDNIIMFGVQIFLQSRETSMMFLQLIFAIGAKFSKCSLLNWNQPNVFHNNFEGRTADTVIFRILQKVCDVLVTVHTEHDSIEYVITRCFYRQRIRRRNRMNYNECALVSTHVTEC